MKFQLTQWPERPEFYSTYIPWESVNSTGKPLCAWLARNRDIAAQLKVLTAQDWGAYDLLYDQTTEKLVTSDTETKSFVGHRGIVFVLGSEYQHVPRESVVVTQIHSDCIQLDWPELLPEPTPLWPTPISCNCLLSWQNRPRNPTLTDAHLTFNHDGKPVHAVWISLQSAPITAHFRTMFPHGSHYNNGLLCVKDTVIKEPVLLLST